MKMLKQPWFLVFLLISSIYTYQFYNSESRLSIGANEAQAETQPSSKESSSKYKALKTVQLTQKITKNIDQLSIQGDLPINYQVVIADQDHIELQLEGLGKFYRNQGQELSDWLTWDVRGQKLSIMSTRDKKFRGNISFKELKKLMTGTTQDSSQAMELRLILPRQKLDKVDIKVVSSNVKAKDLQFSKMTMESVSGSLKINESVGRKLSFQSVSGSLKANFEQLKKLKMKSMSGSGKIEIRSSSPKLNFESVSGSLALQIPENSNLKVDFESLSGKLRNDFEKGTSGGGKLEFSSVSGSARIGKIR